jgi:ketosteroid isomerase-like protein
MKGLIAVLGLLVVLGVAFFLYGSPAGPPAEMTEAEMAQAEAEAAQAISDRWAEYRDALMSGDVDEIMSYWTSDAHLYEPGMNLTAADLSDWLQAAFETTSVVDLEVRRLDIFVHGDVAYEITEADEPLQVEGQGLVPREVYGFFRWEKEDGVWKMDRLVVGPRDAPPEG